MTGSRTSCRAGAIVCCTWGCVRAGWPVARVAELTHRSVVLAQIEEL